MNTTITYEVRFLGTIWQGLRCAGERTIPEIELVADRFPLLVGIERYLHEHEGDFRSIDAVDITRVAVQREEVREEKYYRTQVTTTREFLGGFTPEEDAEWHDATYTPEFPDFGEEG